jgi:hypothetical protein
MPTFHAWIYDTKEDKIIDDREANNKDIGEEFIKIMDWKELPVRKPTVFGWFITPEERKKDEEYYKYVNDGLEKYNYELVYQEEKPNRMVKSTIKGMKEELAIGIERDGKEETCESWKKKYAGLAGYCLRRALALWKSNPRRYKLKIGSLGIRRLDGEIKNKYFEDQRAEDLADDVKDINSDYDYERNICWLYKMWKDPRKVEPVKPPRQVKYIIKVNKAKHTKILKKLAKQKAKEMK